MASVIKVEGLRDLDKAMSELSKAAAKGAARRALMRAGQPVADRAKALVPVDSGGLRDSIKVSTRLARRPGASEFAAVMRAGGSKKEAGAAMRAAAGGKSAAVNVYIGAGQLPHAHLVEFGTVKQAPQPYLRPAWDAGKDKVLSDIKEFLADEVDKAAKRAARKALKAKS